MNNANTGNDEPLVNTRYGKISSPLENDLITKFLRSDGEWAFLEAEFVASHLPVQARVLDIGAYLGTFTLGLGQFKQLSFACLAEGNSVIAPHLENNMARNLNCRYKVVNAVVVDPSIPIGTGQADSDNGGSTSFLAPLDGTKPAQKPLPTISFEDLVNQYGPFDLIKADVEGMEEQLLASYPALLHAATPLLWVECNETPAVLSLVELLLSTGRPVSYFAWPSHNPANHNGNTDPIFPFGYEAGLFVGAQPKPLTAFQQASGCILRSIRSVEDLKQSMWHTPRWAPREWLDLSPREMSGVAGHILTGLNYDNFLTGSEADINSRQWSIDRSNLQLAEHKIHQLENMVRELSSALRLAQTSVVGTEPTTSDNNAAQ